MDHLRHDLAPISDEAWAQIEAEAGRTIRHFLAGRAFVDFDGPRGWSHSAVGVGRVRSATPSIMTGVVADLRVCQPLVEFRTPFELSALELEAADRGAFDIDLRPLQDAARLAALAEDRAIFHGYAPGEITGIAPSSPHDPLEIGDDYDAYPGIVARAVATLRNSGIDGPYAIALGPRCYTGVIETTEHGGYPLLEHMKLILGGPIIWAPGVDGAVVVATRGDDYRLVCGQDFAIGYRGYADDVVELYIEESITLVVRDERAAVALRYADQE